MNALRWERGQGQNHWRGMLGSVCVVVLQVLDEPVLKDKDLRSLTFDFDLVHFMRGAARENIGPISLAEAKRRAERSVADSLVEMGVVLAEQPEPSLADTLITEVRQHMAEMKDRPWPMTDKDWRKEAAGLAYKLVEPLHKHLLLMGDGHEKDELADAMLRAVQDVGDELLEQSR